ncbi:hypothetical protein ACM66B_007015 [Microbotryomycetes sp. NB124-2]
MNILKTVRDKARDLTHADDASNDTPSQRRSLLGRFAQREGDLEHGGPEGLRDYEMEKLVAGGQGGEDEPGFFKEVSTIRSLLQTVTNKLDHLEHLHSQNLSTSTTDSTNSLTRESMNAVTTDITSSLKVVKTKIQTLTDAVTMNPRSAVAGFTDAVVLQNHLAALSTSLQKNIERFRLLEKNQRDKISERVKRQIKIVDPEATEEEINVALEAGAGVQVFAQAVAGTRSNEIRRTYTDTLDRHQQMLQLEQNITELATLFAEVHEMVLQQEQQFQHIESRAQEVDESMEHGVKQVQQAVATARSTRKKRKICAGIAIVVVIVLIIVLAVQIKGTRGGPAQPEASAASPPPPPATPPAAPAAPDGQAAAPPPALA